MQAWMPPCGRPPSQPPTRRRCQSSQGEHGHRWVLHTELQHLGIYIYRDLLPLVAWVLSSVSQWGQGGGWAGGGVCRSVHVCWSQDLSSVCMHSLLPHSQCSERVASCVHQSSPARCLASQVNITEPICLILWVHQSRTKATHACSLMHEHSMSCNTSPSYGCPLMPVRIALLYACCPLSFLCDAESMLNTPTCLLPRAASQWAEPPQWVASQLEGGVLSQVAPQQQQGAGDHQYTRVTGKAAHRTPLTSQFHAFTQVVTSPLFLG
jgi:hypothetical protein